MKFEVQNKDNKSPKNGSSAAPICHEPSQLTDDLGNITLNAEHKMPMQSKPRNPQVIVGQMHLASILSGDVDNSDDEVDDTSLLLAEQNMSSPLTKLHQNVSSIFENMEMRPPTALEELEKHRCMNAMSTEPSTSTGCTQGPLCSAVKTNLGIEQEDTGNNLSHADALAFISGSDLMQNSHDPNPNGEQSINAGKNGSLQETQQKVGGSGVSNKSNGTEGIQAEMDPNCYNVDDKGNITQYASSTTTTDNENGRSKSKEVTKKPTQMQLKSVCRKIFSSSHGDAKIGE